MQVFKLNNFFLCFQTSHIRIFQLRPTFSLEIKNQKGHFLLEKTLQAYKIEISEQP